MLILVDVILVEFIIVGVEVAVRCFAVDCIVEEIVVFFPVDCIAIDVVIAVDTSVEIIDDTIVDEDDAFTICVGSVVTVDRGDVVV